MERHRTRYWRIRLYWGIIVGATNKILNDIKVTRLASAVMLETYYDEGVISREDLEKYMDFLTRANDELELKLTNIFGVCESRSQVKKGKE